MHKSKYIGGFGPYKKGYHFLPYTSPNFIDAFFKGDLNVDGEIFAQSNSVILSNTVSLGASNELPIIEDFLTNKQSYFVLNTITDGKSGGPQYVDAFDPFTKDDPFGQQQPVDTDTFNSIPFVDNLTGEEAYYVQVIVPSLFNGITYTWYLRSLTGFTNSYIKAYNGIVTDPTQEGENWKSNTTKEVKEKTNLVNDIGGAGIDITYPLGKSYFQKAGDNLSFYLIADNNFTIQGRTFPPFPPYSNESPYIVVDGTIWKSSIVLNENLSVPRLIDDTSSGDDLVIKQEENIAIGVITSSIELTIESNVTHFKVRDQDENISNSNSVNLVLDPGVDELEMMFKNDFVDVFKDSNDVWSYYNYRTNKGELV